MRDVKIIRLEQAVGYVALISIINMGVSALSIHAKFQTHQNAKQLTTSCKIISCFNNNISKDNTNCKIVSNDSNNK